LISWWRAVLREIIKKRVRQERKNKVRPWRKSRFGSRAEDAKDSLEGANYLKGAANSQKKKGASS